MKVLQYNRLKASTHFAKAVDYSKHSVKDISLIGLLIFAAPLTYSKIVNTAIQTNSAITLAKFLPASNHLLDSFDYTTLQRPINMSTVLMKTMDLILISIILSLIALIQVVKITIQKH